MTIVVLEDRLDIANLVRIHIEMLGHAVMVCHTVQSARRVVAEDRCTLLVLDLGLPDGDGIEFCALLRAEGRSFPILMLTARTSELERVTGLETGADDYLVKPFSVLELQARIKALLRRSSRTVLASASARLEFDQLAIDVSRREVVHAGAVVELTSTEFDLLVFLARHPGEVFNRARLLSEVWGHHHEGYEHTVNSHINRLRSKLETDPANPRYVRTVWGTGYKFVAAPL